MYGGCQVWLSRYNMREIQSEYGIVFSEGWMLHAKTFVGSVFVCPALVLVFWFGLFILHSNAAKFGLSTNWRNGLKGVRIILKEKLELHSNYPNRSLTCTVSVITMFMNSILHINEPSLWKENILWKTVEPGCISKYILQQLGDFWPDAH